MQTLKGRLHDLVQKLDEVGSELSLAMDIRVKKAQD
jgi:hypothetical protein